MGLTKASAESRNVVEAVFRGEGKIAEDGWENFGLLQGSFGPFKPKVEHSPKTSSWGRQKGQNGVENKSSTIFIKARRIGADPEKSDLVNFRGPD